MNTTKLKTLAVASLLCAGAFGQAISRTPGASGGGGAPTGAAGGDLGGVFPNPSVIKINGVAAPTFPTGTIVGSSDTQTLTNKTVDGVSPATLKARVLRS